MSAGTYEKPRVIYCPYCGSVAVKAKNCEMHDCTSDLCRIRFAMACMRVKRKQSQVPKPLKRRT